MKRSHANDFMIKWHETSNIVLPKKRFDIVLYLVQTHKLGFAVAQALEESIFIVTNGINDMYLYKCRNILFNITLNTDLLNTNYNDLVHMSNECMKKSVLVEREQQEKEEDAMFEKMLMRKVDLVKSRVDLKNAQLSCRRCGSKEVEWTQKQTRGADEAMTVFCVCTNCKTRWRMS